MIKNISLKRLNMLENLKKENSEILDYGGSPVAVLSGLKKEDFLCIFYLRCFCENLTNRKAMSDELCHYLGNDKGMRIMFTLESIHEIIFKKGRKQLVLHNISCDCVGADENSFIHLISRSTLIDKSDAMLIATIMTNSHIAPQLIKLAEDFAMGIKEILQVVAYDIEHSIQNKNKYN